MLEQDNRVKGVVNFGLGQLVASRKTGLPRIGRIVAVSNGRYHQVFYEKAGFNFAEWYRLFPNWPDKPVYTVYFEDNAKSMTLEEFKRGSPDLLEYEAEEQYAKLPAYNPVTFCEDDLEAADKDTTEHERPASGPSLYMWYKTEEYGPPPFDTLCLVKGEKEIIDYEGKSHGFTTEHAIAYNEVYRPEICMTQVFSLEKELQGKLPVYVGVPFTVKEWMRIS